MVSFSRGPFASLYWEATAGATAKPAARDAAPTPAAGEGGVLTPSVGYLLPKADSADPTLSLAQTWEAHQGCYLFLDEAVPPDPATQEKLARDVWALLADPGLAGARFFWISNPTDPSGRLTGPVLAMDGPPGPDGVARVKRLTSFDLRNVAVVVAPKCGVKPADDGSGFTISPGETTPGIYLTVANPPANLDVVTSVASLPLTGADSGCLGFSLALGTTGGTPDIDLLDVGLRLFFELSWGDDEGPPVRAGAPGGAGVGGGTSEPFWVDTLRYPLFADHGLSLHAVVDPLAPLDETRTSLAFAAGSAIESHHLTNLGHAVTLQPAAGAKLVFAVKPQDSTVGPDSPLYLVPRGDFGLDTSASASATSPNLMCGLSGVEYLKLPPAGRATLTFSAGNAFAPSFVPGKPPAPDPDAALLTGLASTAWAYVRPGGPQEGPSQDGDSVAYCAQPDSSVLHKPPAPSPTSTGDGDVIALEYMEVVSSALPHAPPAGAAFPLLPYNGAGKHRPQDRATLEATVVGPARRNAIHAAVEAATVAARADSKASVGDPSGQAPADGVVSGATPQGLLATFLADYSSMQHVTLGLNEDGTQLALEGISRGSDLWTALQSNKLFLVATDPASMGALAANSKLVVDRWPFDFAPQFWRPLSGPLPTFLIFKFSPKPLIELAAQLGTWVLPERFNADPAATFAGLQAFIAATLERRNDPDLTYFVDRVLSDPTWNGVLGLNAHTAVDAWPDQLKGLAGGIDPKQLVVHHAGVQATPVQTSADPNTGKVTLDVQPSSIFGLIDYSSPDLIPAGPNAYDFKVLSLKVRAENSRIASFSSRVSLQVNQLFGELCTLTGPGAKDNNLLLDGVYQQANGKESYVFLSQQENLFMVTSGVVDAVRVARAQFVTATQSARTPGDATPPSPARTRFLMWGLIDFKSLPGFDLFSFGSESRTAAGSVGLNFTNLAVDMTVTPPPDPNQPALRTFAFDAAHLSFDLDQSHYRMASLYGSFPLQLATFVQTDSATAPTDLGYAPVTSPLNPGTLGAPWFALELQLELGTLGAWAPPGGLVAGLLAAWSPSADPNAPNVFIGMKLPGMTGGQLAIPIEGPLKLTIKNIAFEGPAATGGDYVLWLQSIALSLFSLPFPPTGRTDLLMFAKPGADPTKRAMGWYAVYDKDTSGAGGQPGRTTAALDQGAPAEIPDAFRAPALLKPSRRR